MPTPTHSFGPPGTVVYVHYYLFWTLGHWHDRLGPQYPYGTTPSPLPGSVDAHGCGAQTGFAADKLLDIPSEGLYDQMQAATYDRHIAEAVSHGITGFLVSWLGTGQPDQTPQSYGYNERLDLLVQRVDAYNQANGAHFSLGLAFASFGNYARSPTAVNADLDYFTSKYGSDPAFTNSYSPHPLTMWLDSRKYSIDTVAAVSAHVSSRLYLVGDETASSWPREEQYLAGASYYWSSENPYSNPHAASDIAKLGAEVHASHKPWFAPVIAGYNKQLLGGSCVPRNGVTTLDTVWRTNAASSPDGWFAISWNEFVENTYLEPSQRYGSMYMDELGRLIRAGH